MSKRDYGISQKNHSKEKSQFGLGKLVLSFLIGGLVVFPFLLKQSFDEGFRAVWQKQDIPYNIEEETIDFLQNSYITDKLAENFGFSYEGHLIQLLVREREQTYQHILTMIPDDDIIKYWYWGFHEFSPKIKYKKKQLREKLFYREMLTIFNDLQVNESLSEEYDDYGKYKLLARLSRSLIDNIGYQTTNRDEALNILNPILEDADEIIANKALYFHYSDRSGNKVMILGMSEALLASLNRNFAECKYIAKIESALKSSEDYYNTYRNSGFKNKLMNNVELQVLETKNTLAKLKQEGCSASLINRSRSVRH